MKTQTILIVDDMTVNRDMLRDILERHFPETIVYEAENGVRGLAMLDEIPVDLVLLDLHMPVMDGYEMNRRMRLDSMLSHIPVIISSSMVDIGKIRKTLDEGATDYFIKPLSEVEREINLPLKIKNSLLVHQQDLIIEDMSKRLISDFKSAKKFQEIILPVSEKVENFTTSIVYKPSMGISGDFFDFFERDGRLYFMMADVTGHGIVAGMVSSMIKVLFREESKDPDKGPGEIVASMNKRIFEIFNMDKCGKHLIFTAFVGMIDDNTLRYCNAGQPHPVFISKDSTKYLEANGIPLCLLDIYQYKEDLLGFDDDSSVFLYTDGLFCSGNKGDFVNWDQVLEFTEENKKFAIRKPDEFLSGIMHHFHQMHKQSASDFSDDVALLLINRKRR